MTEMQSLRLRSNTARRKAIFAGLLYVIGIIGLAAAAFLPMTSGICIWAGYGDVSVANFCMPFAYFFTDLGAVIAAPAKYILGLVASLLYGLMLIVVVVNAFRAIAKLDHLCMKGHRRAGFNQNKIAVDALGKLFSCSFSTVVVHTVIIMALFPEQSPMFTMIGLMILAACLVIHFVSGAVAGTISRFTVRETIAEYPRQYGMFSPVLRNFFQIAALGGIGYLLKDFYTEAASKILTKWANPVEGLNKIIKVFQPEFNKPAFFILLGLALWLGGFICYLAIFRHAVNPTEFYACGKDKGRKTVRFFAFNLFLVLLFTAAAPIAKAWVVDGSFPSNVLDIVKENLYVLIAMGVALVLFVIECLMAKLPMLTKAYRPVVEIPPDPEMQEALLIYDVSDETARADSYDSLVLPVSDLSGVATEYDAVDPAQVARESKAKWIEKGLAARAARLQREQEAAEQAAETVEEASIA